MTARVRHEQAAAREGEGIGIHDRRLKYQGGPQFIPAPASKLCPAEEAVVVRYLVSREGVGKVPAGSPAAAPVPEAEPC
jgi:hypothetical protein